MRRTTLLLVLLGCAQSAGAQDPGPAAATREDTTLGRHVVLDIPERTVRRSELHAETSLVLYAGPSDDVRLYVGVSVDAHEVLLMLRNVRGEVFFHASPGLFVDRLQSSFPAGVSP